MDINKIIFELVSYLSNSDEFIELKNAKKAIDYNSNEGKLLLQFEKMQESINDKNLHPNKSEALIRQLNDDYNKLSALPAFRRYFDANSKVGFMIGEIFSNININLQNKL